MIWTDTTPGVNGKVGSLVKTGARDGGDTDSETRSRTPPGVFNWMLLETKLLHLLKAKVGLLVNPVCGLGSQFTSSGWGFSLTLIKLFPNRIAVHFTPDQSTYGGWH
jgi:hypothetical protein